jgi:hypothetical protein
VTFIRSSSGLLIRIIFLAGGLMVCLIWSAMRKMLPGKASAISSAKAFRFSEIKSDPDYPYVRTIHTRIRGVAHRNSDGAFRQQIIRNFCHPGDALLLMREPGNLVDSNAVGVIRVCRGPDGRATFEELLGYLSQEIAHDLAPFFAAGPVGFAKIVEITGDLVGQSDSCVGVNIRADIYMPDHNAGVEREGIDSFLSAKRKRIA